MSPRKAALRIEALSKTMQDRVNESEIARQRYEAHFNLFLVAARTGNQADMEKGREELHSCVDVMLDAGHAIFSARAEIENITHNYQKL